MRCASGARLGPCACSVAGARDGRSTRSRSSSSIDAVARGDPVELIFGFEISNVRNSGIAFGLLEGASDALVLALTLGALALLLGYFGAPREPARSSGCAVGLVVGGALGNLADRVRDRRRDRLPRSAAVAGVQPRRRRDRGRRGAVRGDAARARRDAMPRSPELPVPADAAGARLDAWLADASWAVPRARAAALIEAGAVLVDGRRAPRAPGCAVASASRSTSLARRAATPPPPPPSPRIAWEDERPAGRRQARRASWSIRRPGHRGADARRAARRERAPALEPRAVHRLDRDTSGLMLVAKARGCAAASCRPSCAAGRSSASTWRSSAGRLGSRSGHDRRPARPRRTQAHAHVDAHGQAARGPHPLRGRAIPRRHSRSCGCGSRRAARTRSGPTSPRSAIPLAGDRDYGGRPRASASSASSCTAPGSRFALPWSGAHHRVALRAAGRSARGAAGGRRAGRRGLSRPTGVEIPAGGEGVGRAARFGNGGKRPNLRTLDARSNVPVRAHAALPDGISGAAGPAQPPRPAQPTSKRELSCQKSESRSCWRPASISATRPAAGIRRCAATSSASATASTSST